MKNTLLLLIVVFACFSGLANNQKKAMRYVYDTCFKAFIDKDSLMHESVYLDVFEKGSYFYSQGFAKRVANLNTPEYASYVGLPIATKQDHTNFKEVVIKDNQDLYSLETISELYIYKEPVDLIQWDINPNVEQLNGFLVQSATGELNGRIWQVWFTNDITLKEGPYKFKNLPGFVIKAQDTEKEFVFELVESFEIELEEKFHEYENAKLITTSNLLKARKVKANQSFDQVLAAMGIVVNFESDLNTDQARKQKMGDSRNYIQKF
ncbi:GLPGLI family protein [Myroides sp. LJL110]